MNFVETNAITLPTVVVAGLVDGINPCAFTVLLLFITTLLATLQLGEQNIQAVRARLMGMGAIYIAAIFLTYLALGIGLLGYGYLLLYNLVFILPLVAILLAASARPTLNRLATLEFTSQGVGAARFGRRGGYHGTAYPGHGVGYLAHAGHAKRR